jgi:hypothetical protein
MATKPVYITPPTIKTSFYAPSMVHNPQATSPAFSDADTFAGSLSPAPSSVHSPPWNTHSLASPTHQHAHPSNRVSHQQSPSSSSQHSRYHSTSPAFDSDAALPATPASGFLLPQQFLPHSNMTLQQAWNGAPGGLVVNKQNNGADLAMLCGDGVIDGATTSSPASPNTSDDYTRYIDLDTLNDAYYSFLPTSSAPGIGISIDDQDDRSTTWKQGQIPAATSPSLHQQQQQHRTSLADMFADYSSPVASPVPAPSSGDAQPQAIAASAAAMTATTNNGNINASAMSSSFADSTTTAWSGSAYGSPYLTFAAAGMMSGLPASDPGVGGGMSAFSPGAGFAGGAGSSVPAWFASLPPAAQNGAVGIPIASPSQHPQMHQQLQQSFLSTAPPPSHHLQSSQSPQSHPQQQHPTSFQQQHLDHAFTFNSPSPLSPSLSHSGISASIDNFDALFGSYSSSSGVSGLGVGDLGIAPNLIHNSPPPPHANALSPFAQQQALYSSAYEVPWDSGVMEGVDDVSSPHDANALGLGLDGGNGVQQPQRGRRMRRTTVRGAVSPTSPNFALAHMRDEDMDSNASTRHDDGSDNDDVGEASDEDAMRDDEANSDDDYEDDEYRPRRQVRRRRVSHTYVGAHTGELSFSPPAISISAPNASATSAARDIAANGVNAPFGSLSNSRVATRRQGTIRGAPGPARATTTSTTTTGITIHTANGITYASLPSASASSAPNDGLSAAYLAANLIGGGGGSSGSMTKRSRGRQVPTVRLVDTSSLPAPGDSSSRSPVRPTSTTNNSEEATATSERSTSSRARRRSRLASEAAAQDAYDGVYEEGTSGASQNDDDDSEYDENGASSARSGRSSGAGGRSLRASTRNARNTRRKVKASSSLATLHAGSTASGPGGEDIIVGGIGGGNVSWSDGRTRSYVCRVNGCGKCFQRGEHLKRHIRSIHTNEKRM